MLDMQNPPKYTYTTIHVPLSGGPIKRVQKTPNYGEVAHWLVGLLNWGINKSKIADAMEALEPEIDRLMSTDGGVMIGQNFKVPPKMSGNSDKPMFTQAYIVGAGCSYATVAAEWRARQQGPQIRPYYGPGWTIDTQLIWLTMNTE